MQGVGSAARAGSPSQISAADYVRLTRELPDEVRKVVPAGATVLVVSRGDEKLLELGDRNAWHFPRDERGRYVGYHPADSQAAVNMLEDLRGEGAQYLVFPSTAFWWLDHYADFRRHLEDHYRILKASNDVLIFGLTESASGERAGDRDPHEATAADGPLAHALSELVENLLPSDAIVAVVSHGDESPTAFDGFETWQFPESIPGGPGAAVSHLEMLRANGAQFLVIPLPAFSWLERNPELAEHLRTKQVLVTRQEHVCEIYELCAPSSKKSGDRARASKKSGSTGGGLFAAMRRLLRGTDRDGSGG